MACIVLLRKNYHDCEDLFNREDAKSAKIKKDKPDI